MTSQDLPIVMSRFAHSIFCDDLRREDNGKMMFIGVYEPTLVGDKFPFVVQALNILTTVTVPKRDMPSKLRFRLYFDDELIQEHVIDELPHGSPVPGSDMDAPTAVAKMQMILSMRNWEVTHGGMLKVRVVTERETLPAGVLMVGAADTEAQALAPA